MFVSLVADSAAPGQISSFFALAVTSLGHRLPVFGVGDSEKREKKSGGRGAAQHGRAFTKKRQITAFRHGKTGCAFGKREESRPGGSSPRLISALHVQRGCYYIHSMVPSW